jgi:hypothetical protein
MSTSWLEQIFDAQAVDAGGVVRRNCLDVHRMCGLTPLIEEVKERGFHMVQTGDQYVVLCNEGDFKLIV